MERKCPGKDERFLRVEIHKCGACGHEVEIFSDEFTVICPECKTPVSRNETPSCIDWCKYARQCLGEKKWNEIKNLAEEKNSKQDLKDRLISEMRKYFGSDTRRIIHAESVTGYAEEILAKEKGSRSVVIAAAILHDIGIKECEKKYNSTDVQLQEKEGPPVARAILKKAGIKQDVIDEVCAIIACHHSPGENDTENFKVLWDSDWLVNFREEYEGKDKKSVEKAISKIFMTGTGRELAIKIYL